MLKKLLGLTANFMPSGVSATPVRNMRHLQVLCAPQGFPTKIEWDLNDRDSIVKAQAKMSELHGYGGRNYFLEKSNDALGANIGKEPDIQENMVTLPGIYAG